MASTITKKMKLVSITQTAARSQAMFVEEQKAEAGKPSAPGKGFSFVTNDPKDLQGLVIDKVYTITIS